jgi:exodeoxyribonuclease-3
MKILSYNIREGGADRLADIAAIIREQQPDAAALLEATSYENARQIADELGMRLVFGEGNSGYHVGWLSRLPILRSQNYRHPRLSKTLLEIEVGWDGATLCLFATHLASRWDGWSPADEVPIILEVLAQSGGPHLLVGDFNALRPGDPIGAPPPGVEKRRDAVDGAPRQAIAQLLDAGYTDAYRALHPHDAGYTYPSNAPWLRLDYHFASRALAVRLHGCDVVSGELARRASDHLPVWTEHG